MSPTRGAAARLKAARAARTSVFSNIFLTGGKLAAGLFTGSVSILSEALHSGLDLAAAVMALLAVRKGREPADADHNFGHGKYESMSGLAEGLLILAAVGLIVWGAVGRLLSGETEIRAPLLGVLVMGISAAVNVFVSRMLFRVSKETDSVALEADAWHLRTDVWTSVGVLAGMAVIAIGTWAGFAEVHHLDPIVAIGVAIVITRAALDITRRAYNHLVDRSLPAAEVESIQSLLREHYPELSGYHSLRTRQAGPERYIDLHLEVPGERSVAHSHILCDHLEKDLQRIIPGAEILIHVEPKRENG
ncbi:MAG TPA: cation diffusion facilitator family transporter [Armatimonadota bacterium]|nr:cation diffusion facilitator family transporter [Armatimonadota bacterium]